MCKKVGISRSGYYKSRKIKQLRSKEESKILEFARSIRQLHPYMGCRKIYAKIKPELKHYGIKIGRDRLFTLFRKNDMLIRRKRNPVRTTDSNHRFKVYKNLIKGKKLTHPNQVWASDITYIKTEQGYLYLSLITDLYSRKIVGYEINDNLETTGCIKALNKALRGLRNAKNLIHHSDRGSQYCSTQYTDKLKQKGIQISMTEENHCYENATAERVNGILKYEYGLKEKFANKQAALTACRQAVKLYNSDRPHLSLGMKTPDMVHENVYTNH